jgi:hypothetical protein
MAMDKKRAKACCSKENEALKNHLAYCDTSSRTEEQKHHCYRFAAWQSGRRARRCTSTA